MSNNIMGIDLNVDHNFLEAAVRDTVLTAIASAMDKEEVVQAIVHEALSMKVDKNGKVNSYSSYNEYTILEYYVKTAIRDEAVKMAKEIIAEKTPLIRENVRRARVREAGDGRLARGRVHEVAHVDAQERVEVQGRRELRP